MAQLANIATDAEVLPAQREVDATAMDVALRHARTWPYVLFGAVVLALLVGGLGIWAMTAKLDGAVIAPAAFTVESKRKTIQHLEGGIVREILVREGQKVRAGQVLLRLDATVDKANFAIVESELTELEAQRARLLAELRGDRTLDFGPPPAGTRVTERLRAVRKGQRDLFLARLRSRDSERGLRAQRVTQLRGEVRGLLRQRTSNDRQVAIINKELRDLRRIAKRGLVPRRRLLALEREAERIRGQSESINVSIARARSSIDAVKLEGLQAARNFQEQVTTELRTIAPRIKRLAEQKVTAARKLALVEVRAPSSGYVVDLKAHTVGGVIRPGGDIMDIVPAGERLIVEARVAPTDIDKIKVGQVARIQLSAFDPTDTPEASGTVLSVSADSLKDERAGTDYYLARIKLGAEQPKVVAALTLVPGMPATVYVQTGARTPLSYLFGPILGRLPRVFAEG